MFRGPYGNSPTRQELNSFDNPSGIMFGGLLRREEMTQGISPIDERRDIRPRSLYTTAHPFSIYNLAGDDSFLPEMFRRNLPMDARPASARPKAKTPCRTEDLFYYFIFEKPDMWTGGIDAIVQRFLQGDLEWYLVFVRFAEFGAFVQEMKEFREKIVAVLVFAQQSCRLPGASNHDVGVRRERRFPKSVDGATGLKGVRAYSKSGAFEANYQKCDGADTFIDIPEEWFESIKTKLIAELEDNPYVPFENCPEIRIIFIKTNDNVRAGGQIQLEIAIMYDCPEEGHMTPVMRDDYYVSMDLDDLRKEEMSCEETATSCEENAMSCEDR
ncbi:hypothetical protein AVEN_224685-1 [Araneus ventricosus]|uniref:Uncharacterized protein n=1 Tax=Araneus ventricosus TaxID=182803 RepID=A0A4Y2LQF1_ARAVE|nr:hypothetical protein AVEN_224685-1 [Araneus ventricosus]